jgi:hypothetical protein
VTRAEEAFSRQKARVQWVQLENLLGTSYLIFDEKKANRIFGLVQKRITIEQYADFCKPVENEDIRRTIFAMKNNKSLGPDGFTAEFFKHDWPVVGGDVLAAIKYFFPLVSS